MCIVTFNQHQHPKYKLIIASNRDEFYERPTAQAHFWEDHPSILAGRDLKEMGTWLGVTQTGRIAILTNFRDLASERLERKSRGTIVKEFLSSKEEPLALMEQLQQNKMKYNGFNFVGGTVDQLYHYGNNELSITSFKPGTHSISNGPLNVSWPKTKKAKHMLEDYIRQDEEIYIDDIFTQLNDRQLAPDDELPNTGIDFQLERNVSSIFIDREPNYGTKTSTVILVTYDNDITFVERTFHHGRYKDEKRFEFSI